MITYQTEGVDMPAIKKRETSAWIKAVAETYGKKVGEIAYIFCSDEKILEVNRQYLQHDYYTDIITFDYCEGNRISGDLFISLDTVRTNAEQFGATYETELHRVIIHGILHLCGINDKGPGEHGSSREPCPQHAGRFPIKENPSQSRSLFCFRLPDTGFMSVPGRYFFEESSLKKNVEAFYLKGRHLFTETSNSFLKSPRSFFGLSSPFPHHPGKQNLRHRCSK